MTNFLTFTTVFAVISVPAYALAQPKVLRVKAGAICSQSIEACNHSRNIILLLANESVSMFANNCEPAYYYNIRCDADVPYTFGVPEIRILK